MSSFAAAATALPLCAICPADISRVHKIDRLSHIYPTSTIRLSPALVYIEPIQYFVRGGREGPLLSGMHACPDSSTSGQCPFARCRYWIPNPSIIIQCETIFTSEPLTIASPMWCGLWAGLNKTTQQPVSSAIVTVHLQNYKYTALLRGHACCSRRVDVGNEDGKGRPLVSVVCSGMGVMAKRSRPLPR